MPTLTQLFQQVNISVDNQKVQDNTKTKDVIADLTKKVVAVNTVTTYHEPIVIKSQVNNSTASKG